MSSVTMILKENTRTRTIPVPSASRYIIVWDDPIDLMGYVTSVFQRHFGYSSEKATRLVLGIHKWSRVVASAGVRECTEVDVVVVHDYGLRAVLEAGR